MTVMPAALVVEDRLVEAHQRLNSAYAELFVLIVEYERHEAYLADGARTMADWVSYRLGYGERESRELCRMARALEHLPAIDEAFTEGLLTIDKLRWLTLFCTPEEDPQWARDAVGLTAAQVRRYAQHRRRMAREASDRRFRRRYLRIVPDVEEGVVKLWGRLPEAEGMAVKRAIDRCADRQPPDPETGGLVPYEKRCADALVELCSASLAADPDPDRASVVCHVDADVLASTDGVATLEGGMPVGAETVRRLLCDGRVQVVSHGEEGHPIGIGSVTRVVPHYLRRVLLERDGGCAWTGCSNKSWLHAHHVTHVVHGGRTDEDNLVMLCASHHRRVHEGGWRMRGRPGRDLQVVRPDGRLLDHGFTRPAARRSARGP